MIFIIILIFIFFKNLSVSSEFTNWTNWTNRSGGGYLRYRNCERHDEDMTKVTVNRTKCNGSDVEEIGNGKLTAITMFVPKFCK